MFTAIMTTSIPRHSEWTQECFVGMKGNDDVMRSDESITLVTSYWLSLSRVQILYIHSG